MLCYAGRRRCERYSGGRRVDRGYSKASTTTVTRWVGLMRSSARGSARMARPQRRHERLRVSQPMIRTTSISAEVGRPLFLINSSGSANGTTSLARLLKSTPSKTSSIAVRSPLAPVPRSRAIVAALAGERVSTTPAVCPVPFPQRSWSNEQGRRSDTGLPPVERCIA